MMSTIEAVAEQVTRSGVVVWRNFVPRQRSDLLRSLAEPLLRGSDARVYPRSTRVWELYRYGDEFVDVVCDSRLIALATRILGPHPIASDFSLNQVSRGGLADRWHIDYPFNEMPIVVSGGILGLQCILALSPFSEDTGATEFQPGSHLRYALPPDTADVDDTDVNDAVRFTAEPGDLLVMAAATWHRAGVNSTDTPRTAILMNYVESWVRPMSDPPEAGPWGRDEVARITLGMQRAPENMALDGGVAV